MSVKVQLSILEYPYNWYSDNPDTSGDYTNRNNDCLTVFVDIFSTSSRPFAVAESMNSEPD